MSTHSMSEEQLVFLVESMNAICDAVKDTKNVSVVHRHPAGVKSQVIDAFRYFVLQYVFRNESTWEKDLRFVRAVRFGIDTGSMVLEDVDDAAALLTMIDEWFYEAPAAVEYYAANGELLELVTLFTAASDRMVPSARTRHPSSDRLEPMRIKLRRFYAYDVNRALAMMEAGEDPTEYMHLPLEVRLSLSDVIDTSIADVPWRSQSARKKLHDHLTVEHSRLSDHVAFPQVMS